MTTTIRMTNFLWRGCVIIIAISSMALTQSCTRTSDKEENIYFIFGNASGIQQVPPVSTPGTGTLDGTYDVTKHKLNYSISWSGLSSAVTAISLHGPANIGASADVVAELPVNVKSPTGHLSGSLPTDDLMTKTLVDGNVYYTISTSTYPDGEIRGQVIAVH
jgi:hypothetical protein